MKKDERLYPSLTLSLLGKQEEIQLKEKCISEISLGFDVDTIGWLIKYQSQFIFP